MKAGVDHSITLPEGETILPAQCWTFDIVEERLVEAALLWRRAPDKTAHWHQVRAYWPEMQRHERFGDYDARGGDGTSSDVKLKPAMLAREEMSRMEEASAWIGEHVPERDRRLVCLVLMIKAAGHRPQWIRLLKSMGMARGAEGLRKRYSRAVAAVAGELQKVRAPVRMARA